MTDTGITCDACRFFARSYEPDWGECRRHPPVPANHPDDRGHWARVAVDDWCGDAEAGEPVQPLPIR